MKSMLKNCEIKQIMGYNAAGVAPITSDIIDMANFDGVLFVVGLGTIIENGTIDAYIQQNTINSASGMARLATTAVHTVTAAQALLAKSCIAVDVYRPQERYLCMIVDPSVSNAVILGVTAILYKGRVGPVAQGTTVLKNTQLTEPVEV